MHQASNANPQFLWRPSLLGGMAAIGIAALFGTLVSNVSLWIYLAKGLTAQEAYARMGGFGFSSPTELLSFAVLLLAGFSGGYSSALYGGSRHVLQAFVAGAVSTTFFIVMGLGPSNPPIPAWYAALHFTLLLASSLAGGYLCARSA